MNYDQNRFKVITWKHPLVLHWIINPGIAVNELFFGLRVPKVMLSDRDKRKSRAERSFIPCPHCGTVHSGRKWSAQNKTAFGNWFGLYCDHCHGVIPCIRNATSLVLLALTFPIWYWFKDRWKSRWLQVQQEKFSRPLDLTTPSFVWWKVGLDYGVTMYVFMELLFPLLDGSGIEGRKALAGIPVWIIGGLAYGWWMKAYLNAAKGRKKSGPQAQQAS